MGRYFLWTGLWTAALCLARPSVLTAPPYEDQALGIWAEAEYLADTDFDYMRLRYEEKQYMDGGGVRSYMISALPTLLAIAMKATADHQTPIVLAHLAVFACAAWVLTVLVELLYRRIGWLPALLLALAVLSTPPFLVQAEMIGMEMPLTAAVALTILLVARGRYGWGALASLAAFFVKATGEIVTIAVIGYLAANLAISAPDGFRAAWRRFGNPLLLALVALAIELGVALWADDPVLFLKDYSWPRMIRFPWALWWCPDVGAIWLLSLALVVAWPLARMTHALATAGMGRRLNQWRQEAARLLLEDAPATFSVIYLVGLTLAIALYVCFPRYVAPGVPAMYLIAGWVLLDRASRFRAARHVLPLVILFNGLNLDGRFYPRPESLAGEEFEYWTLWHPRMCMMTERSEEYWPDLAGQRAVARFLEENYRDHPILAEFLFQKFLTRPVIGYVREALPDVRSTDDYQGALIQVKELTLARKHGGTGKFPVLVWSGKSQTRIPRPDGAAEILFTDGHPYPVIVYRLKEDQLPSEPRSFEDWYLDQTWAERCAAMRFAERRAYLESSGRSERALREAKAASKVARPDDPFIAPIIKAYLEKHDAGPRTSP